MFKINATLQRSRIVLQNQQKRLKNGAPFSTNIVEEMIVLCE